MSPSIFVTLVLSVASLWLAAVASPAFEAAPAQSAAARADLYYIENLIATLETSAKPPENR